MTRLHGLRWFPTSLLAIAAVAACGDNLDAPDAPDPGTPAGSAPRVAILAPAPGAILDHSPVEVRVRVRDDDGQRATLETGGGAVALDLDARGEATLSVELGDGHHELRLIADDGGQRAGFASASIVVDTTPPVVEIVSPTDPVVITTPTFDVRVRVRDAVGVAAATLRVGDEVYAIEPAQLDADGEVTLTVAAATSTSLHLLATDIAGHAAEATTAVGVDLEAPAVALAAPRANTAETRRLLFAQLTDTSGIASVSYAVNGGAPVAVAVEGAPTSLVLREALALHAGANQLAITVTDTAGHARTDTIDFRYGLETTAGGAHSGAIVDGELQVWGRYNVGQLGLGGAVGDAESRLAPARVPAFGAAGSAVAAIAFNQNSSLALRDDGTVWTWGANGDGQLGHGDAVQRTTPTQIAGLSDVIYAHLGYSHALALRADGAVLAWGNNARGQAGVEAVDDQLAPVVVAGIPSAVVELTGGSEHSVALTVDGRVFVWGRNQYGNLGQGAPDDLRHPTPVEVPGLTDVIDIANGRDHILALRADGSVMSWGLGASGQLGYGENTDPNGEDRAAPVAVLADAAGAPLTGVVAVYANGNTSQVLRRDAAGAVQLWGWGQNFSGQLATGERTDAEWLPRRAVVYTAGEPPVFLDTQISVRSFGVGATHAIVRATNGAIYAWGWSFRGSLGVPALPNAWAQTVVVEVALAP